MGRPGSGQTQLRSVFGGEVKESFLFARQGEIKTAVEEKILFGGDGHYFQHVGGAGPLQASGDQSAADAMLAKFGEDGEAAQLGQFGGIDFQRRTTDEAAFAFGDEKAGVEVIQLGEGAWQEAFRIDEGDEEFGEDSDVFTLCGADGESGHGEFPAAGRALL